MYPDHALQIVFSPTNTTRKVLQAILQGLGAQSWSELDLTYLRPLRDTARNQGDAEELVLIGMPVYAGRIPALARERILSCVKGTGQKAVLVVVYGNRAYDDALRELWDLALELGFVPVAAAAFVGEHSFSTTDCPIAEGRPDQSDLTRALEFGANVREMLHKFPAASPKAAPVRVPGNFPYRDGVQPAPISPETDATQCVLCGACVQACPAGAIHMRDETPTTDPMLCLRCCACTRICPTGARVMIHPRIRELGRILHEKHAARREPEFFLIDNE